MTKEIDNAINWIEGAGDLILPFYPKEQISHQVIWADCIFEKIRSAIKQGNIDAVKLGCQLIIDDPKIPFGKAIKSSIARALKAQTVLIDVSLRDRIIRKTINKVSKNEYAHKLIAYLLNHQVTKDTKTKT